MTEVCFHSYVFYCFMNFLCILLFFYFYVFYYFFIFFGLNTSFQSILCLNKLFTKPKQENIMIYSPNCKKSLCHWFCTQNGKNLTFRVDLWSQKVTWLRNGWSDFRKFGVKISARLQRKNSWNRAARGAAVWRTQQNLSRGGLRGPPPVQLGLSYVLPRETYWNNSQSHDSD